MLSKVFTRSDMPAEGVDDMICLSDLSEGSLLWNLKIRYENNQIYVRSRPGCLGYAFFERQ